MIAALLAGAVAGLSAYLSAGLFDRVDGTGGPLRLAMLPPPWLAAAGLAAGSLLVLAAARALAWARGAARPTREEAGVFMPLFATAALSLPYLPWLADAAPALTILAGPLKYALWLVVLGLVVHAAAGLIRPAGAPRLPIPPRAVPWIVLGASLLVCGVMAARLTRTPVFPGGDEPHYLVIAQSLWRDGDLQIENNHARGDTFEYYGQPLAPHYLVRGANGAIYSIHPIGLPVLLAPVYALGRYGAVLAWLVLVSAIATTLAWRLAARTTTTGAATFGWLACAMTVPWVFNSFTVYPEIPGALAVMIALSTAYGLAAAPPRGLVLRLAVAGTAVAALPWFSTKYGVMGAALALVALGRLWFPGGFRLAEEPRLTQAGGQAGAVHAMRARLVATAAFCLPCFVSAIAFLLFFKTIWGTFSPSAPYGDQHAMDLAYLARGAPGLLFDQEYGVVPAAPVLVLGLIGLGGMLRSSGEMRRVAIEILAIGGALLATVGAFHIWWGGSAVVGRPLISGLLLLTIPTAWCWRACASRPALRAAALATLLFSLSATLAIGLPGHEFLLVAGRDGTSQLLAWWSPWWPLVTVAPTFLAQPIGFALLITAAWIGTAAAALALAARQRSLGSNGAAGLAACTLILAVTAGTATVLGIVRRTTDIEATLLSSRARVPLLDRFDAGSRPLAILYRPFQVVAPETLPSFVRLTSRPEDARPARVTELLLNHARWALPAGEYLVELRFQGRTQAAGEVGLQLARGGPPASTWSVAPGTAAPWAAVFTLPVDVSFVGFRASPAIAALRPSIVVQPRHLVGASARPSAGAVSQARRFGGTLVFFHDSNADPEATGFWTRRNTSTRLTLVGGAPSARLRIRSGPVGVRVVVSTAAGRETLTLARDETREVALPASPAPLAVTLATEGGFVPQEVDPAVRDARPLGCWVEVVS